MKLSPTQKRAARKQAGEQQLDMNLVSLIDIFTILIFFLLTSASGVEVLSMPKALTLPEAVSETPTRPTIVVAVDSQEILVEGRRVATVAEVLANNDDLIVPLQAELQAQSARVAQVGSELASADGKKRVTIMGDKDIPYRLLRKVMTSAAQADFADVSFVVRQKHTS